jgi:hypothetical protein
MPSHTSNVRRGNRRTCATCFKRTNAFGDPGGDDRENAVARELFPLAREEVLMTMWWPVCPESLAPWRAAEPISLATLTDRVGDGMGIGFAVPIDSVKAVLPQLRAGRVVRGSLGVRPRMALHTAAEASALGLPRRPHWRGRFKLWRLRGWSPRR